jgi:outer membrane protein assembly factor BamB
MRRLLRAALCAVPILLAACSGDSWFGGDDEPPLPGERVPVMLLERQLEPDPRLADVPVRLPPPQRNEAWPQNGGVPTHAMHHLAAGDHINLAWQAEIGRGSSDSAQMLARPVVADGRIYTMDAEATITAFDAQGGRQLWRLEPEDIDAEGGLLGGGLAYDGGWLFVSLSSGKVLALNAESGEEIWRQDLTLPLRAAPTVAGGKVLLVTADNQLYALDGQTGRPLWRHAGFVEGAGLLGGPSPAVDGGVVVVPYSSAEVFGLLLDNGRPLWSDTVQRPRRTEALAQITDIDALPVIDGERAYIASYGGQMAAIDLRQGFRAWDVDLASTETPWFAGDFIYVLTSRSEIVCLLAGNGRIRWVSPLPRLTDPDDPTSTPIIWTGPVLVGDRLLVAGSNQEALTVSPYNGEILGRIDLPGPVSISPVVANGTIFLLTDNAQLLAYR